MPAHGLPQVRRGMSVLLRDISETKTRRAVAAIVSTGAGYAKLWTPVDTAALINSQRKSVKSEGGAIVGRVWYTQHYAYWLEHNPNWTGRKKPSARPGFLRLGFEDSAPQAVIKRILDGVYRL